MQSDNATKKFVTSFTPRFSDFDLQGILNSRQYVDLLVEARFEQMQRCYNYPIDHYLKRGQHWVVAKMQFLFISPIYPGREILVTTAVSKIEGAKATVEFSFETTASDGRAKTHATGTTEYVLIDLATKKPVDIPENERAIYL